MRYDFNFSAYLQPIVSDFNKAVEEFLERIEKEIYFTPLESVVRPTANQQRKSIQFDEETKRIVSVTYSKTEEWNYVGAFTFIPHWDGRFTIEYRDAVSEVIDQKEDLSITSFIANLSGETIDHLKAFWENPRSRKAA